MPSAYFKAQRSTKKIISLRRQAGIPNGSIGQLTDSCSPTGENDETLFGFIYFFI